MALDGPGRVPGSLLPLAIRQLTLFLIMCLVLRSIESSYDHLFTIILIISPLFLLSYIFINFYLLL
jgi:hypothetical protein